MIVKTDLILERLSMTFTVNGKCQIEVDIFSDSKMSSLKLCKIIVTVIEKVRLKSVTWCKLP